MNKCQCRLCERDALQEELEEEMKYSKELRDRIEQNLRIQVALIVKIDRLTAELAKLRERTRWIPVNERLPKRDGFYLVLENVNQVAGYYHWCKEFGWNTDGGRINIQSVTHWMPLPEPPEATDADN